MVGPRNTILLIARVIAASDTGNHWHSIVCCRGIDRSHAARERRQATCRPAFHTAYATGVAYFFYARGIMNC